MVEISKLKKLILGTEEDRALANEYILEYNLDVLPDEFTLYGWNYAGYTFFQDKGSNRVFMRTTATGTWAEFKINTVFASTGTSTSTTII